MKLLIATAIAGVLMATAACEDETAGAATKHHGKAHTISRTVVSRAHVAGSGGPARWFLTLKGKRQPVKVSKATYTHCQIGEHYPACG